MFRDKEMEQCVLACLMIDETCLNKIKQLNLQDFTFDDTRAIYKAIGMLNANKEVVDIITVNNKLREMYPKIEQRALIYLNEIIDKIPTTANFNYYVKKLKQETNKRKIEELANKLKSGEELGDANENIKEFIIDFQNTEKEVFNEQQYIIPLTSVANEDYRKKARVLSGIKEIDKAIGGFYMGEVSIWTGKTGEGKSTFVNQMVCEAIDQNYPVFVYSGELVNSQLKSWINQQLAGEDNVVELIDEETGLVEYGISKQLAKQLEEWYKDKIYIYNNEFELDNANPLSIVEVCKIAYSKFGCKVFVIDNLMSARFTQKSKDDYYTQQSHFVGELVAFAKQNNVHVHIIAHPRKTINKVLENDDISGTMDIANRADNVFVISKIDKEKEPEKNEDGILTIRKNRSYGVNGRAFRLYYNPKSRRFTTDRKEKKYNWGDVPLPF